MKPAQYRMARAALRWTTRYVASVANVPVKVANALEIGTEVPRGAMHSIRAAFEAGGVIFIDDDGRGPGVCFKAANNATALKRKPAGPATDAVERMEAQIAADRRKR